ncbi:SNF2-related protein [Legionella dresdenensis]|uniref:SNF2-related protein n=1 Tax=Legionella dresdenensis TaxID=450200 RepID=A0ABV8CGD1_9GAMM
MKLVPYLIEDSTRFAIESEYLTASEMQNVKLKLKEKGQSITKIIIKKGLDCNSNTARTRQCQWIATLFNSSLYPYLTDFDLSNNGIDSADIQTILSQMSSNNSIRSLNLSHNLIRSGGTKFIAKQITNKHTLAELNLSNNNLFYKEKYQIELIGKGSNPQTEAGLQELMVALQNPALKSLNLESVICNHDTFLFLKYFSKVIRNESTFKLTYLNLSNNHLVMDVGFIRALEKNGYWLHEINLSGNNFTFTGILKIAKALATHVNSQIQKIDLRKIPRWKVSEDDKNQIREYFNYWIRKPNFLISNALHDNPLSTSCDVCNLFGTEATNASISGMQIVGQQLNENMINALAMQNAQIQTPSQLPPEAGHNLAAPETINFASPEAQEEYAQLFNQEAQTQAGQDASNDSLDELVHSMLGDTGLLESHYQPVLCEIEPEVLPEDTIEESNLDEDQDNGDLNLVEKLLLSLNQIIIERLNHVVKKDRQTEYVPLMNYVQGYHGYYILPLLSDDLVEINECIRNFLQQYPDEGQALQTQLITWFRQLRIVKLPGNDFYFTLGDNESCRWLSQELEQQLITNYLEVSSKIIDRRIKIDQETANALIFTQVDYLSQTRNKHTETGSHLAILITPPSSGQILYSLRLSLVRLGLEGFEAFFPVTALKKDSQLHSDAQALFQELDFEVQSQLGMSIEVSRLEKTKEQINTLLEEIDLYNQSNHQLLIIPVVPHSISAKLNSASNKGKEAETEDDMAVEFSQPKSSSDKAPPILGLEMRSLSIHRPTRKGKQPKQTAPVIIGSEDDSEQEKPSFIVNFNSYLQKQFAGFGIRLAERLGSNKASLPTTLKPKAQLTIKSLPLYFNKTLYDMEQAISRALYAEPGNANPFFKLDPYQVEGISQLYQQHGGLLADQMGLGKTEQTIAVLHLRAKEIPEYMKLLVVTTKGVIQDWYTKLIRSGFTAGAIASYKDPNAYNNLAGKKIVLISYETLAARLESSEDNELKLLTGYLPAYPEPIFGETLPGETSLTDWAELCARKEFNYYGRNKLIYNRTIVGIDGKTFNQTYWRRLPNPDELTRLAASQQRPVAQVALIIAWNLINESLIARKQLAPNRALLSNKLTNLLNALQAIYKANPSLETIIPLAKVADYFSARFNSFMLAMLAMDECAKAFHSETKVTKTLLPLSRQLRCRDKNNIIIGITATPSKNDLLEMATVYHLISPLNHLPTHLFRALYERTYDRGIKSAIKKYLVSNTEAACHELKNKLQAFFNELHELFTVYHNQRVRRTSADLTHGTRNVIPVKKVINVPYCLSAWQTTFINNNQDKINSFCRNYSPDQTSVPVTGKRKLLADESQTDLDEINVNLSVLEKIFLHPMLLDSEYGPRLYAKDSDKDALISEYIAVKHTGNLDDFIAQSGWLKQLVETAQTIFSQPSLNGVPAKLMVRVESRPFAQIISYVFKQKLNQTPLTFNGSLTPQQRQAMARQFNESAKSETILVSSAGKEGVQLRGANHVIPYPEWNQDDIDQFIARAFRRDSEHQEITVYDFICEDNPLEMKRRSHCAYKEECNQFFFNHQQHAEIALMTILLREMRKEEKNPEIVRRLEQQWQHLLELARMVKAERELLAAVPAPYPHSQVASQLGFFATAQPIPAHSLELAQRRYEKQEESTI